MSCLTEAERKFMCVYLREELPGELGYAMKLARERGLTYDHFAALWPFYKETRKVFGDWGDHLPPLPDEPTPPCPWRDAAEVEKRIRELGSP